MKFRFNGQKGFSIIELMIVVGIIGVLTSVGLPKVQVFLAKSKRTEVRTVLGGLNTFEQAYYADTSTYSDDKTIGFSAVAGTPNMKFNTTIWTFALTPAAPTTAFTGKMTSTADKLCVGATSEVWTVTQSAATTGDSVALAAPNCT